MSLKHRVYNILKITPNDNASRVFNIFIFTLIILNSIAVIAGTVDSFHESYETFLLAFEVFSVVIFTAEYIARLWSCTVERKYHHPVMGRIKYALTPLMIIDLLAIFPFYISHFVKIDLRLLRTLRLFRIFRIFNLRRYSKALRLLGRGISNNKEEISIVLLIIVVIFLISSSVIYYMERDAQPEAFANIPESMWWAVETMTTVGYGDVVPATGLGKVFGGLISVLGISLFVLPAAIIGSGLIEEFHKEKKGQNTCPHCGKDVNKPPSNPPA